jgi:hypothetical protein
MDWVGSIKDGSNFYKVKAGNRWKYYNNTVKRAGNRADIQQS